MAEGGFHGARSTLGLILVGSVVLIGGALLQTAAGHGAPEWCVPAYVVVAIVATVAYWFAVFVPHRRVERELGALERLHSTQCEAVKASLEELRHGDLVGTMAPAEGLAEAMEQSVEAAARSLGGLVQQIQSSSVEVAHAAREVQETSSELASGSTQQAAAVVEITATMEELAQTAGQIATNAASQAELASRSEQAGVAGAEAVDAAVDGVEAVRQKMDDIAGRADTLGSRSREIYRVADLIREIAQETHILSLNAAIEAAAAGEHGERFSVVADEVRRLAERSRESVESVRALLDEFSGAIRAVVVATEEGSKAAAEVLAQSRSTEESIEQLTTALADTARAAREISLATQEQRSASDQVVLTLKEVSSVIQRMAEGLNHFTGTAERLNQLALSIQLLTQSFRIDSAHSLKHQALSSADGLGDFSGNLEAVEGRLQEVLRRCPYAELAYLVDAQGVMVGFASNDDLVRERELPGSVAVGQVYGDRPWFQAVSRDGRTALTPLYGSLLTGDDCFTIASAVKKVDGSLAGILGIDVNVRNWTRI